MGSATQSAGTPHPSGRTYKQPVVLLVNRWTGSMGEGIAIGFDGLKRATSIGDRMARLLGAICTYSLPQTGIGFSLPLEKPFHVWMPREDFRPLYLDCMAKALKLLGDKKAR